MTLLEKPEQVAIRCTLLRGGTRSDWSHILEKDDMAEASKIELDHLRQWIGRSEEASDLVTPVLSSAFSRQLVPRARLWARVTKLHQQSIGASHRRPR